MFPVGALRVDSVLQLFFSLFLVCLQPQPLHPPPQPPHATYMHLAPCEWLANG